MIPWGVTYLTGVRTPELDRFAGIEGRDLPLGLLLQPCTRRYMEDGRAYYSYVAIDNGCFSEEGRARFNLDGYLAMVREAFDLWGDYVLFATAEDVPMDWRATLRKSLPVLPKLRMAGVPAALVVQDGATPANIPWDECDAIFIGGSTEWKLSPKARAIVLAAHARKKWVHMGRVNSMRRLYLALRMGCQSADGTFLAFRGRQGIYDLVRWVTETWAADPARRRAAEAGRAEEPPPWDPEWEHLKKATRDEVAQQAWTPFFDVFGPRQTG